MKRILIILIIGLSLISGCVQEEIIENKEIFREGEGLYDIFYNSQCYRDNKAKFGTSDISFKIEQLKNVKITNSHKIYPSDEGDLVEVNLHFQELGAYGDGLLTPYKVIEAQNATIWRVQGGIFSSPNPQGGVIGGGWFYGCLVIVDANSGKILTEGWYGYS